jgi:two-component system nitrate/nitrite response regulator NarL
VLVIDAALLERGAALADALWDVAPRLLLLADRIDAPSVYAAVAAGASGYLSKESTGDVLCRGIVAVARGDTVLDPAAQAAMAEEVRVRTRDDRPLLSPREQQILHGIAKGQSAPEIARDLHLSTATVKTHMIHLYGKLGVTERAAAVAVAMRQGLSE